MTEREKRTTSTEASTSPTAWSYKDAFANLLSANLRKRTPKPVVLVSKETELDSSVPRQAGTVNLGSVQVVDLGDVIGDQSEGDHEHGSDHHHGDGHDHGHDHGEHGEHHGHDHGEHGEHHDHEHGDHLDHGHGHGHHTADHFASLAANTESLPEAPPGNLGLKVTSSGLDEGTKNFVKVNNDMAFR